MSNSFAPKQETIQPIKVEEVDSTSVYSSSNVFSATDQQITPIKHDLKPTERVNPFDKNNTQPPATKPLTATSITTTTKTTISSSSLSDKKDYSLSYTPPKPISKYELSEDPKLSDSFTKDRPQTKPIIQSQPLKRAEYRRDIRSNSIATNSDYTTTKYNYKSTSASDAETGVPSTSKFDPYPDVTAAEARSISFKSGSLNRSRGSISDADIIFGDLKTSKNNSRDYSSFTSSTDSDNIFGPPESKSKTSSDTESSSVRMDSYKIYDGIQNHAFQDFDSPVRNVTPLSKPTASGGDDYDLK